ncbi:mitochondrial GTPase [Neurospora crassa OR74A]|uniref:Mitochondrial GTPase n=1 Tax=Neurospora crassa (strain ATCC 24698 / 74-OR23-1A / CBS 708.71 / DSM 1257 / FGSC 987) TaxID=367110 RepID=Q1K7K9_NEUCR|nr:mitochondrial GTPase [Neurospora crassa OR74A]EAA32069.2 mitochondrial GTPase [Neurospora crassa OR74A]|eukprot:XP_961305.2 mitochondrial GTPase [Neurospora crassa OR74A]
MFRHAIRRAAIHRPGGSRVTSCALRSWQQQPTSCLIRIARSYHEFGRRASAFDAVSGSKGQGGNPRDSTLPFLTNDTIYALSSGSGRAGIAVIRISGPGCLDVYNSLCPTKLIPKPRYAAVRTLTEPTEPGNDVSSPSAANANNVLDTDALVLYFPGPKTVTGEDVLELHVHGGPATVKAVLSAIPKSTSSSTIRYAEQGEFTKRAFLNNRLDLAQVEALGDTLSAETEQQRRAAIRGTSGVLGKTYESWREQLLLARGEIEALIDFSEDQHFDESPTELLRNVTRLVKEILHSIKLHELGSQRSELLRNGIRIALLGPPNVGKSSLMNLIVGREASIVSSEAGTTRDIVEASLDIRGYLCSFADTAGIRTRSSLLPAEEKEASIGKIEEEGIRRARQKALDSDVIIVLASVEPHPNGVEGYRLNYDLSTLDLASSAPESLLVINKSETVPPSVLAQLIQSFKTDVLSTALPEDSPLRSQDPILISCRTAEQRSGGVDDTDPGKIHHLISRLSSSFAELTAIPQDMEHLLGVTARQNELLGQCRDALEDFMAEANPNPNPAIGEGGITGEEVEADIVLAAEHLRVAAGRLAAITGKGEAGDVEEVLGVIFEKFCVGK